ncbi:MAG: hypothetical protein ACQXXH_01625 [Candidatus Bathyarchaeia archaeon]|jgi:hypothetical protein|nr:hypothetical protein [Candidatus Bathyarchaeota archaeon A05DMB-4]MDH7596073.1 hypothetical protein [Candidatus Bathyarchaeota archaeon]
MIFVLVLFVVCVFSSISRGFAETTEVEAYGVISNVSGFLERAFLAVGDAERSGANVTLLKVRLNYAGLLLANASASFGVGDFSAAVDFALLANDTVNGMGDEAYQLKTAAEVARVERFHWSILVSSLGISLVVFVVLVGWVYFKRYYVRRVLGLKPEVSQSES